MRHKSTLLAVLVFFGTAEAHAESNRMGAKSPWVALSTTFGFSGNMGFGADSNGIESSSTSRANPTAGFVINGGFALIEHLKIGGQLGFHWLESESMDRSNTDRNFAFDLQLLIRPYITVLSGKLEFYLDVTQGLTVIGHEEDRFSTISQLAIQPEVGDAISIVPETFIGWSGQILAGVEYHFLKYVSAHVKIGYTGWYAVAKDSAISDVEASVQLHQFALHLGASYKF